MNLPLYPTMQEVVTIMIQCPQHLDFRIVILKLSYQYLTERNSEKMHFTCLTDITIMGQTNGLGGPDTIEVASKPWPVG